MVRYQSAVLCNSCLLCIPVRIWPAQWSIRAWRHQKKEQYAFLCTVRSFSLWNIGTHTKLHGCSSPSRHPLLSFSGAHLLNVSVQRQQDSPLWLALCDCRGLSAGMNLSWVLPENAKSQTSMQAEYEGQVQKIRLTYQFHLASHEGQNLTCVYCLEDGATEKSTVYIPRYCEFDRNHSHINTCTLQLVQM